MGGLGLPMLAALVVLFVPGCLFLRALRVPGTWAVCTAPVMSMVLYTVLTTLYGAIGVPCGLVTVLVLPSVALLGLAIARELAARSHADAPAAFVLPALSPLWLGLYVVVGLLLCRFIFVSMLPAADALMVARDLPHHLNQIRAFLDSTRWSSMGVDLYQTPADIAIDPITPHSSAFYPSTWHVACTLVALMTGAKVAVAINALNAAIAVVCYPLALLSLLGYVFAGERLELAAGSVVCLASMYFPWHFLGWGPLYPNMAGFALMLSCAWMVLRFAEDGVDVRERLRLGALFALACVGLAFLHPNAVIAVCIFLAPYLVMRILHAERGWHLLGRRVPARLVAALFVMGSCALWYGMYRAPFMRATVLFDWDYHLSEAQGLVNWLTLAYLNLVDVDPGHPALAVAMLAGLVWIVRNRRHGWLAATYLVGCVPLYVSYCLPSLRHLVSGFWYTDPRRLAAMATIFGVPVASLGLAALMRVVAHALRLPVAGDTTGDSRLARAVSASLVAAFVVAAFFPGFYVPGLVEDVDEDPDELLKTRTAVEIQRETIKSANSDISEYMRSEREFMEQVLELVGPDAVVVNQPFDGSNLAYGDCGLRTYYRYMSGFASDVETPESEVIRMHLADIASDESVRKVVDDLGIKYVVKLGDIKADKSAYRWNYFPKEWRGIDSITPETPGFELVLEQREMRLYRIVG